jgi:hypothetical protein
MSKTWKELAEELKSLAEVILEQAKRAFSEGDVERGLMLTKEFRNAIRTAGELNMIAQGAGELEEDFEEEDIEKALGLEDEEEDLEEEVEEDKFEENIEEDEEGGEEDSDTDYDDFADDDRGVEEEADSDEEEMETVYDFAEQERRKIKNQVGDSVITLEQILRGIVRKKT